MILLCFSTSSFFQTILHYLSLQIALKKESERLSIIIPRGSQMHYDELSASLFLKKKKNTLNFKLQFKFNIILYSFQMYSIMARQSYTLQRFP